MLIFASWGLLWCLHKDHAKPEPLNKAVEPHSYMDPNVGPGVHTSEPIHFQWKLSIENTVNIIKVVL